MQIQVNVQRRDLVQEAHEMLEASPKTVYGPRHDHIELPAVGVLEHLIEPRAPIAAAAEALN